MRGMHGLFIAHHATRELSMRKDVHSVVYPALMPSGITLDKNVQVTMRDGIGIAVDVYKPADMQEPLPAILAYSPFQKERSFESAKPVFYCPNGYVCIQAAERGSGFNEGKFSLHGRQAAQDGFDIIEWIAEQPWCNHDGRRSRCANSGR